MQPDLSAADRARLADFLAASERPEATLGYYPLQGFLYAVVSCPEMIPPSEWMPAIYDDAEAGYETVEQAEELSRLIVTLYNQIAELAPLGQLPPDCEVSEDVSANIGSDAPLGQFAQGFLCGHRWLSKFWEAVPVDLAGSRDFALVVLTLFAFEDAPEQYAQDLGDPANMPKMMARLQNALPEIIADYVKLGRASREWADQNFEEPSPGPPTKVGRNSPCPCGSGKKSKKCCGRGPGS